MGYTHYWYKQPELPAKSWAAFIKDVTKLIEFVQKDVGIPLNYEDDVQRVPVIDADLIRFNGIGDDGHETFYFERKGKTERNGLCFDFCKTAHKPYDIAVTAVLVAADYHFGDMTVKISSDGSNEEWAAGRNLVERVLGYGKSFKLKEDS